MVRTPFKGIPIGKMEIIAARFRALGEVSRLQILKCLQDGETNVTDLVERTGLSQPNVSRHLTVLTNVGLIGRRKVGLNVMYRVIDRSLVDICTIVCESV